nr:glycosyl transferase family 90 [Acuticoccus kalidii]
MRLNAHRHFGPVRDIPENDIPFREKDRRLLWRGTTTGRFHRTNPHHWEDRGSRYFIMRFNAQNENPNIDIGFTDILDNIRQRLADESDVNLDAHVRPKVSLAEHLQSKYLLSLEGNDVATGLKWMLASNSVVIMPPPLIQTWACEGLLKPFVHYVPVRQDLADLEDVYQWCVAHDDECEAIAEHGKAFIASFMRPKLEEELMVHLAEAYAKRVMIERPAKGQVGGHQLESQSDAA